MKYRHELKHEINTLNCDGHEAELKASDFIKKTVNRMVVKSKSAQKGNLEINYEVRLKEDNTDFVSALADMEGVNSAVLVSYNT